MAADGCRDVLRSLLAERHFGFDVERAIYLTVLHRLMVSGSDRHARDWHQRLRIPGTEALGNILYRTAWSNPASSTLNRGKI